MADPETPATPQIPDNIWAAMGLVEDPPVEAEAPPAEEAKKEQPEAEPKADEAKDEPPESKGIASLTEEQLVALRRAKVPQAVVDSLDDVALAALADRMASLRTEHDRAYDEARGQKVPEPEAGARKAPEAGRNRLPPADPEAVDLKRLADPVLKAIGLSESEGEPLVELLRESQRAVRTEMEGRLAQIEQALIQTARVSHSQLVESVRDELRVDFPQLTSPERWEKVRAFARKIQEGYDIATKEGLRECLRDAATVKLGAPKAKPSPDETGATRKPRADKPTPTNPTKRERPKTQKEIDLLAVTEVLKPSHQFRDVDAVRRAAGI